MLGQRLNVDIYAMAQREADLRRRIGATTEQAIAELGAATSCRINFVPLMLGCVEMDAALELCEAAKRKRLSEIKPETRRIKQACEAWGKSLYETMEADQIEAFNYCVKTFGQFTQAQRWIAWQKIKVDANNQVSGDPEIAAWGEWIRMLDKERLDFEAKMDAEYHNYVNVTFKKAQDLVLLHIMNSVNRIRRKGFTMLATPEAWPAPGVVRNKAWEMAGLISKEEGEP